MWVQWQKAHVASTEQASLHLGCPWTLTWVVNNFVEDSLTWAYWHTIIIFEGQHKTHHVFHGRHRLDLLGVAGQMPVWRYGNTNPGVEPSWVFVVSGAQLVDTFLSQWHLIFSAGAIWCWISVTINKIWLLLTDDDNMNFLKIRLWHLGLHWTRGHTWRSIESIHSWPKGLPRHRETTLPSTGPRQKQPQITNKLEL